MTQLQTLQGAVLELMMVPSLASMSIENYYSKKLGQLQGSHDNGVGGS